MQKNSKKTNQVIFEEIYPLMAIYYSEEVIHTISDKIARRLERSDEDE